jgi:hypothetical protein
MSTTEDRLWLKAQRYISSNQITAARIALESLVQRAPTQVGPRLLLASTIMHDGRVREAALQMIEASAHLPNDAGTIATVAQSLQSIGEILAARNCLESHEAIRTRDGESLLALAHAHQGLGDHRAAVLALMDQALATGCGHPDLRYFRALQLQFDGQLDSARAELETCVRVHPTHGRALLALARIHKCDRNRNHLDYIETQLKWVEPGSEDHASFEFARFKELEDCGDYDAAFAALQRGNVIMYARTKHDTARELVLFDTLATQCDAEFVQPHKANFSGPMPIFIIGLPRSGTTLLDRILDNHSQVISTGERSDFPKQLRWAADCHGQELIDEKLLGRIDAIDYAELGRRYLLQTQWLAGNNAYFIDKLPPNFMLAGLIHRALPQARILHLVRDPLSVCFSNYKAMFGNSYPYSYNLEALAAHYRQYRRLMQHWHCVMPGVVIDIEYRDLVNGPEETLRRVLTHCGLPFEPGMTDLRRNSTPSNTLSSAQVREPIHKRALDEWRRYANQLEPFRETMKIAGFLED